VALLSPRQCTCQVVEVIGWRKGVLQLGNSSFRESTTSFVLRKGPARMQLPSLVACLHNFTEPGQRRKALKTASVRDKFGNFRLCWEISKQALMEHEFVPLLRCVKKGWEEKAFSHCSRKGTKGNEFSTEGKACFSSVSLEKKTMLAYSPSDTLLQQIPPVLLALPSPPH